MTNDDIRSEDERRNEIKRKWIPSVHIAQHTLGTRLELGRLATCSHAHSSFGPYFYLPLSVSMHGMGCVMWSKETVVAVVVDNQPSQKRGVQPTPNNSQQTSHVFRSLDKNGQCKMHEACAWLIIIIVILGRFGRRRSRSQLHTVQ